MKKFIDICQFALVLMGLMICGLFVTSLLGILPLKGHSLQWIIFAGQNIFAFFIPAILTWKFCFKVSPFLAVGAECIPPLKMIGIALLLYFVGMPALNQIVYWNQEMKLPEFLSSFEDWCRNMENLAEEQTKGLLNTTSLFPTIMNILIIGVMTGIGEEFFFRGAFQKMLIWCRINPHVAIWTAAVVFSALHFQIFGFIPRVLLGAFFGYLYWWSGNIWINSIAHALNNILVIISTWCINKGLLSEDFDTFGVSDYGLPIYPILSMIAVIVLIFAFNKSGLLHGDKTDTSVIPSKRIENATESK